MSTTLTELKDKLKQIDEISLLEILQIDSELLVDRFADIIEEKYEDLVEDFPTEEPDQYT